MRIRLGHLGAPIISVRTDGDTVVSIDSTLPAPRAEAMLLAQFPEEDAGVLHKLVVEAYLPPFGGGPVPTPRQA